MYDFNRRTYLHLVAALFREYGTRDPRLGPRGTRTHELVCECVYLGNLAPLAEKPNQSVQSLSLWK